MRLASFILALGLTTPPQRFSTMFRIIAGSILASNVSFSTAIFPPESTLSHLILSIQERFLCAFARFIVIHIVNDYNFFVKLFGTDMKRM
jgi:hypothetical protein